MLAFGMGSCSSDDDRIMGTVQTQVSMPDEEDENKNEENVSTVQAADELSFFMTEALYGNDKQGRRTFFSADPEEEKCLMINSEQEFREAYKGDKELPKVSACTRLWWAVRGVTIHPISLMTLRWLTKGIPISLI